MAIAGILCLFPCRCLFAQSSQVTYDATVHDFGKIQEADGPVSFTFTFTNTSRTLFLIEFVSVSCGCTTPEYSKEPVLPGKTGQIKVTYNPLGRPGVFNTPVIVTSNERRDQVTLTIKGEVVPKPKTIQDQFPTVLSDNGLFAATNNLIFGYLEQGNQKIQSLEIYNNGTKPMRLEARLTPESRAWEPLCTIEIIPALLQPQERGTIRFTYDLRQSDSYGLLATAFVVTIDGQQTSKPIAAYATATDDFSQWTEEELNQAPKAFFSAQFHHFGTAPRNRNLTREFQIRNDGNSPLVIRKVTANGPNITYALPQTSLAPGESTTLRVTLKTSDQSERMSESLSIVVNDPDRPMREIRLGANVE
ncbi:MAG: DUF1573 domain-containing protein [Rikenellaceae bacterium]|nr:DUF1573 domain-containing protein [Rikenellaceae bacterium]